MPMPMVLSQHFLNFSIASSVFSANSQSQFNGGSLLGHLRLQFVANPSGSIVKENVHTPEHRPGFKRGRNSLQCTATHDPSGNTQALTPELKDTLDKFITSNKVVLFMKGTKDFPQCGFSNTIVQILNSLNVPFETFNILENESLRQGLKVYSNWPTFPQLYIDGEFFGGCDITIEAYKRGELQELLEKTMCS